MGYIMRTFKGRALAKQRLRSMSPKQARTLSRLAVLDRKRQLEEMRLDRRALLIVNAELAKQSLIDQRIDGLPIRKVGPTGRICLEKMSPVRGQPIKHGALVFGDDGKLESVERASGFRRERPDHKPTVTLTGGLQIGKVRVNTAHLDDKRTIYVSPVE